MPRFIDAHEQKKPDEIDQAYKCRIAGERYSLVQGETEAEVEMVDFFKQVLAVDSRGVISSFALSVMVSRNCGKGHGEQDTSLVTIAKTERQMTPWMHPDHLPTFQKQSSGSP